MKIESLEEQLLKNNTFNQLIVTDHDLSVKEIQQVYKILHQMGYMRVGRVYLEYRRRDIKTPLNPQVWVCFENMSPKHIETLLMRLYRGERIFVFVNINKDNSKLKHYLMTTKEGIAFQKQYMMPVKYLYS